MSRAIDAFEDEATREEVRAKLLEYFGTDTIWYVPYSLRSDCSSITNLIIFTRQNIPPSLTRKA